MKTCSALPSSKAPLSPAEDKTNVEWVVEEESISVWALWLTTETGLVAVTFYID